VELKTNWTDSGSSGADSSGEPHAFGITLYRKWPRRPAHSTCESFRLPSCRLKGARNPRQNLKPLQLRRTGRMARIQLRACIHNSLELSCTKAASLALHQGWCHSGYGNWLPKITLMVTTERWTNGVLTSILLRVGSSGGGLPDALQVLRFAGRRYFLGAHVFPFQIFLPCTVLFPYLLWILRLRAAAKFRCETFSTLAHLIHSDLNIWIVK
jgi:hypothetical protein